MTDLEKLEDYLKQGLISRQEYLWMKLLMERKERINAIAKIEKQERELSAKMLSAMPVSEVWKTKESDLEVLQQIALNLRLGSRSERDAWEG
jgi:hypothetical protein